MFSKATHLGAAALLVAFGQISQAAAQQPATPGPMTSSPALGDATSPSGATSQPTDTRSETERDGESTEREDEREVSSTSESSDEPQVAPGSPLRIQWEGPRACGKDTALEEEARRLLGDLANTAGVLVRGSAKRLEDGRYRVELHLYGAVRGERNLESTACPEAVQAAGVVLALAINSEALLTDEPQEAEPPLAAPPVEPVEETVPEPRRKLVFFTGIAARLSGGVVPFPHVGAEVKLGVDLAPLRMFASGFIEPTTEHSLEPTGRYALRSRGGSIGVCGLVFGSKNVSPRFCGGLFLTDLRVSPSGLEPNRRQRALLFSATLGAELALHLNPHVSAVIGGHAQIPTTRPTFTVDGPDDRVTVAHQVSPGGVFHLGCDFAF